MSLLHLKVLKKKRITKTKIRSSFLHLSNYLRQVLALIHAKQVCDQARAFYPTRLIADAPANWLDPQKFAEIAQSMSEDLGLKCQIKNREEIQKMGMGSFNSVAQGSDLEPQLITIEIEGHDKNRWVSLVGKGLTFDSGGISLKPSNGMGEMKYDLCGGAAVLGAAHYLAHQKPPTNVVCVIGAVENMPQKIGDWPGIL